MKSRLRKSFSSLLVSYLITMVLTVSIGAVTYYGTLKEVEKDAADLNLSLLRQSSELMDTRFNEVESLVDQLSFHPKITYFMNISKEEEESNNYKAIETWNYIQTYRFTSSFITDFYIGFLNSDIIMSPKDISYRMPMYYEESLKYEGLSYEAWYAEFLGRFHNGEYMQARNITIGGKTNSYVTYMQTIPLGFRSSFKGILFVLISEAEIHQLLNRLNLQEGGWSVISDENGKVITTVTDQNREINMDGIELTGKEGKIQHKLNGEDMLISYYISPRNKWKYVSAVPMKVVMKKADYIRKTNTYVISIGLVVGLIVAVFFAYRNSKPIRVLIKKFEAKLSAITDSSSNEYNFLEHSISKLIHNNEALQTEIEKQSPLLRAALFDRLFRGEFNDNRELDAALADGGLQLHGKWFMVMILRMEWLDEPNSRDRLESLRLNRVMIKDWIHNELGASGFVHDLREEKMAVLLSFPHEESDKCLEWSETMASSLCELFNQQADFRVAIGLGSVYGPLLDVYRSFKEAEKALEWIHNGRGETSLRYDRLPKDDNAYFYPLELEQRIINLVKSGNEGEVRKVLESIRSELAAARHVSADTKKLLVFDLSATLYKLIHEMHPETGGDERHSYHDFVETVGSFAAFSAAYDYITAAFLDLCRQASKEKKSHNVELKDKIIAYLNGHYMDGNMSLSTVADTFGISEVYLSQFFKEQTGENFSTFMENKRMSQARELLLHPNLTVDEIAKQVGYFNTNTFYKAFKRIEGVSPGAFRNRLKV